MTLADANVLIYAFRKDMPQHEACHSWLTRIVEGDTSFGVSPMALSALVRVATNRRVFKMPSASEEAFKFCDYLRGQPHCQLVEPGERHWDIFKRLCIETEARGSDVSDAWFAALAIEWGCEWITFDRDYARFPGLKWQTPTA